MSVLVHARLIISGEVCLQVWPVKRAAIPDFTVFTGMSCETIYVDDLAYKP